MHQNRKANIVKVITLVIITAFITFAFTIIGFTKYLQKDGNIKFVLKSASMDSLENAVMKVHTIIDQYYLKDVDEKKLIDGAIKGYIDALGDKYSKYLVGDEFTETMKNTTGHYVGIGVYITTNKETNQIVIITPMKDSPAEQAGIKPGDILLKINDVEYTGEKVDDATNAIQGESGTTVKLELKRGEETYTVEVERKEIKLNKIQFQILDNNIGYIGISSFDEGTADDFKETLEYLTQNGATKFIIDTRGNTGGIVDEAVKIAEYILPKDKTIMITIDKNDKRVETKSKENNILNGDLVMLINGNSASSTEILAAAIKDNERGTLVGTKTYGKGVMQQIMKMTDGSALKLTTEEFITPNGDKIDGIGIEPNEVVKLVSDNEGNIVDTQLARAIEILK